MGKKTAATKKVVSIKFKKELNMVETILEEYFDKEYIHYPENNCKECDKDCKSSDDTYMIILPLGFVSYEDKEWLISYDLTFIENNPYFISIAARMVIDFYENGINIIPMEHHVNIFNKKEECVGTIFESDIIDYCAEHDLDYEEALDILSKDLIKNCKKELKKIKEVVH